MASKREQVVQGVADLTAAALPGATGGRNRNKPDEPSPGGDYSVGDGDPGEPEVDLSPTTYNYAHRIPVEIGGYASESQTKEQVLDELLQALGAAVAADRTLGGLCDYLFVEAPTADDVEAFGAEASRFALVMVVAEYATQDPLN